MSDRTSEFEEFFPNGFLWLARLLISQELVISTTDRHLAAALYFTQPAVYITTLTVDGAIAWGWTQPKLSGFPLLYRLSKKRLILHNRTASLVNIYLY